MLFTALARIVAALNANRRPGEIAGALVFGFALAMIPAGNLVWITLFFLLFLVKVNLGIALLSLAVFTPIALAIDPWLDSLGFSILTHDTLYEPLTAAFNAPLGPFLGVHNTAVAGALIVSIVAAVPLYLLGRWLVALYRDSLREKIAKSRLVRWWEKLPMARALRRLSERARSVYEFAQF